MNEGEWSSRLGVPGIPAEAEELMVMRDIALSRMTGTPVHFQHLSTSGSVAMVRAARSAGVQVTAEAAPHHFVLTDECCAEFDPIFKVNPPLRGAGDVAAVKVGLADGTVDAIATDHAPHAAEEKEKPFDEAPLRDARPRDGPRARHHRVGAGAARDPRPPLLAPGPHRRARQPRRPVVEGRPANLVVIDPAATWTVDPAKLASRSRNTPYGGRTLTGRVRHTIHHGEARRDRRGGPAMTIRPGVLVLNDGSLFEGELLGAELDGPASGEVVFNTAMTGYQEIITDPSYAGQIITFTSVHIGNYGVTRRATTRAPARAAGAWSSATSPAGAATGGPTETSTRSSPDTVSRASAGSTPGASPATCATTVRSPARSAPTRSR